ncbi:unnamed protein product [Psylliodes chrysocephalus]|uniref:Uncharacterized protein n=1 Tax=Psylliodes chrysocephalus TaxID=3402493 RepID=A0A9P0CXJ5_9CUCU|nr:unnamed protein product [Psylliodes chrysocephala]
MRYGHKHLEQAYRLQLKNRKQKRDESLQELELDIAKMVLFAYPSAPESMIECLAVQAFVDGLCDHEMQRILRLARHKTLGDVLSAALEYEAATLVSSGYSEVRTVKEEEQENKFDQLFHMIKTLIEKQPKTIRCWNCGEMGNVSSSRERPKNTTNQKTVPVTVQEGTVLPESSETIKSKAVARNCRESNACHGGTSEVQ